jgi:hypothetical protein
MTNGVVLPIKGFLGGELHVYSGPAPKNGAATILAGLAQSEEVAGTKFEVTINGVPCVPEAAPSDLSLLAGVAARSPVPLPRQVPPRRLQRGI